MAASAMPTAAARSGGAGVRGAAATGDEVAGEDVNPGEEIEAMAWCLSFLDRERHGVQAAPARGVGGVAACLALFHAVDTICLRIRPRPMINLMRLTIQRVRKERLAQVAGSLTNWVITDGVTHATEVITLSNKYVLAAGDYIFT